MDPLTTLIQTALEEDSPHGDITTQCLGLSPDICNARLITKGEGVFYGIDIINTCCTILSPEIEPTFYVTDGQSVTKGTTLALLLGPSTTVLKIERILLNFVQRLSGIATITNQFVETLNNSTIQVLDTRKTTPGLRWIEKKAVIAGGGQNHRNSLSDMVLIKENHLTRFLKEHDPKELTKKLQQFKLSDPHIKIEIEVESLIQLTQFDLSEVDYIMLDNFSYADIQQAIPLIRAEYPTAQIELSGNITLDTIADYRTLDVDRISIGSLTHSVKALDLSLLF
jgi:nicotinate-nucleotide pyrophosphorylase (carboxylating)